MHPASLLWDASYMLIPLSNFSLAKAAAASDVDQCPPLLHQFEMSSAFQIDAARFLDFGQAMFSYA
jgi:hypothetical protein